LFAAAVAAGKETEFAGVFHLLRKLMDDRGHAALVLFAGPVGIEVTQADGGDRDPVQSRCSPSCINDSMYDGIH
jgi:hypothetical protein